MADDLGERTEQPTERRIREAREQGQVARSTDLSAGLDMAGALVLVLLFGAPLTGALAGILRFCLDDRESGQVLHVEKVDDLLRSISLHAAILVTPVFVFFFILSLIGQVIQVGWLISPEAMSVKLDKFNPITGMGRVLGKKNLIKTIFGALKLSIVTALTVYLIMSEWSSVAALAGLEVRAMWAAAGAILMRVTIWLVVVLLIIGIVDYMYHRWDHTQDLRMTKQQVKDEHRSMDGDPEVKGRRLRIARQMAMQRLAGTVPKADVIVTNPTHFAIALQYDPKTMAAPKVIAKGADYLAFRIREIAAVHKIPIVERPPLARAIYWNVPVGRTIQPEYYEAVAEILAYVYRLENRASGAA